MSHAPARHFNQAPRGQRGIALVTCLLILVMLTLLAISMYRGFGLQTKIASNTREKERAFEAAESTLQYGEYWLQKGTAGTGVNCTAAVTVAADTDMRACSNALATATDPDNWGAPLNYLPNAMRVNTSGGTVTDGYGNTDINYAKSPRLYISYMGLAPDGLQQLYSVTAGGYGGSAGTTAVVQSVYAIKAAVKCLDEVTTTCTNTGP